MSTSGKCITRRFLFDAMALATLKSQATDSSGSTEVPTRIEAVSAIIWKSAMAASKAKHGFQKPSVLTHLVNLRKRISLLSLAENAIGNLLWTAAAEHRANSKSDLHELVRKLREAISNIDGAFAKKFANNPPISESFKGIHELESRGGEIDYFGFSSWRNSDFYGADFGWGKPVWVSSIGLEVPLVANLIISADSIEASVTLDEEDMAILQRDTELLKIASVDPSPLVLGSTVLGQRAHMKATRVSAL